MSRDVRLWRIKVFRLQNGKNRKVLSNIHYPMLFQCWASVEDGWPILKQHLEKITHIHQPYRNRQKIYLCIVTKFFCKTFDSWYPCCAYNFLKIYKKKHYVTSSLLRWLPSEMIDDKTQSTLAHISPLHYPFCNKLCADKRAVGDVGILASDQF